MSRTRVFTAVMVAFLVAQVLAVVVHGVILARDYEPYEGLLLRRMEGHPPWQALFLPVAHLSYVSALVWLCSRLRKTGSNFQQGIALGLIGWFIGQVPMWLIWYAQQPWPGALVLKQLVLELLSSVAVGVSISTIGTSGHRYISKGHPGPAVGE